MSLTPPDQDLVGIINQIEKDLDEVQFYISGQTTGGGISIGSSSVPNGGTTGQALVKSSNADGDVTWSTINVNTVTVGTTTTTASGTNASVTNSGSANNLVLDFAIPRGNKGDTGAAGADGKSVLNGSGAPSNSTGNNGDFYIDTANNRLYGPKSAGAWPETFVSLVGPQGNTGATGSAGSAATITIGSTTTTASGTSAAVTNSGTSSAAVFNFSIPRGDKGDAGTAASIAVGSTTTGAAGSNASVTNSGTSSAAILNFTIPTGPAGPAGPQGSPGATDARMFFLR